MASRIRTVRDPVELTLDGETLVAERGEPLAYTLLAADKMALARSPKLHRPRGPSCLRGACDGCLARVDGEPDIMTCMVASRGGERIETQNVLGSRKVDLLRVTDWFFPHGVDHHHLLAGVPVASGLMQTVARRIAGLGRLPDAPKAAREAARREVDVLVVGAGAAGLVVAGALARAGADVLLADDAPSPGGSLRARDTAHLPKLLEAVRTVTIAGSTTAAGVYEGEVLLVGPTSTTLVRPRLLVLATGAHDGVLAFEGNDLPGVVSARAAALLTMGGISLGKNLVVVTDRPDHDGPYTQTIARSKVPDQTLTRVAAKAGIQARGRSRVQAVAVAVPGGKKKTLHEADALIVDAVGCPAFELAGQAGANIELDAGRGGYVPHTDAHGRAGDRLWCAGEVTGIGQDLDAIIAQAELVARDVARVYAEGPRSAT